MKYLYESISSNDKIHLTGIVGETDSLESFTKNIRKFIRNNNTRYEIKLNKNGDPVRDKNDSRSALIFRKI